MRRIVGFCITCSLASVACSDTWPQDEDSLELEVSTSLATAATTWTAEHVGPASGFVASVRFAPGSSSRVWISGDDASGLYQSLDGGQTRPMARLAMRWRCRRQRGRG